MELIGLIFVVLLYLISLYFINRNMADKLIEDLMKYAKLFISDGSLKKEFVKSAFSEFIGENQSKSTLSKITTKVIEKQVDSIIESKVDSIKSEKIDLGAMENATILAERVLESDSKGLITVYGRVTGGEIKKTEWEVGANYVHKIK